MTDPIVTPDELATAVGRPLDEDRAALLLDLAQGLCETVVTPLPTAARAVVIGVAVRMYLNPGNVQAESAAPFSNTYGAASGGLYLTKQDRASLLRLAGRGGAFTIDPTPADAGQGLPVWDQNVTWPTGVPLVEDQQR